MFTAASLLWQKKSLLSLLMVASGWGSKRFGKSLFMRPSCECNLVNGTDLSVTQRGNFRLACEKKYVYIKPGTTPNTSIRSSGLLRSHYRTPQSSEGKGSQPTEGKWQQPRHSGMVTGIPNVPTGSPSSALWENFCSTQASTSGTLGSEAHPPERHPTTLGFQEPRKALYLKDPVSLRSWNVTAYHYYCCYYYYLEVLPKYMS